MLRAHCRADCHRESQGNRCSVLRNQITPTKSISITAEQTLGLFWSGEFKFSFGGDRNGRSMAGPMDAPLPCASCPVLTAAPLYNIHTSILLPHQSLLQVIKALVTR